LYNKFALIFLAARQTELHSHTSREQNYNRECVVCFLYNTRWLGYGVKTYRLQYISWTDATSYCMGTGGFVPGSEAAVTW